jgi:hypothetical protein
MLAARLRIANAVWASPPEQPRRAWLASSGRVARQRRLHIQPPEVETDSTLASLDHDVESSLTLTSVGLSRLRYSKQSRTFGLRRARSVNVLVAKRGNRGPGSRLGQPYNSQIRSHVSKLGDRRVPASSSRYSRIPPAGRSASPIAYIASDGYRLGPPVALRPSLYVRSLPVACAA